MPVAPRTLLALLHLITQVGVSGAGAHTISEGGEASMPRNVQLTSAAWNALNAKKWPAAIEKAAECIDEFEHQARRQQAQLEATRAPLPPTGTASDSEKTTIMARGPLNDVATCLFIKGRALEMLGKGPEAVVAYSSAATLTYARCWDPHGWFWSPSEGAQDRIKQLGIK